MTITFEEHKLIGKALKIINHKVLENFKTRNKREYKKSSNYKAFNLCSKLKDNMEEVMFKECPREANTDIYYGTFK